VSDRNLFFSSVLVQSANNRRFTNYVPDAPIKLLIHGFNSHGKVDWILEMKTKYLKTFNRINVISVDWKKEVSAKSGGESAINSIASLRATAIALAYVQH
jgi:hypothetical protein